MSSRTPTWHLFIPKLYTVLSEGYGSTSLQRDVIAGLTVAIVALPLAMALAIASGATPEVGLVTAIVAGFLISALGGSRFQIGGPTGAFVVVVYGVIEKFGYQGLLLATLMAGLMLVIAGIAQLGTFIKYIPEPVVTGFTSGIAVVIFTSQVKDFFGLELGKMPGDFLAQWQLFWSARSTVHPAALAVATGSLALILVLRRFAPRQPGFLYAVVAGSLVTWLFMLPITTIGSRFGELRAAIPAPHLPVMSWPLIKALMPSAFTIAFLAGVESLLCAMVADGMTGRRHRSNCELVAQGVASLVSALVGGLPATGAIARTATNIRAGAVSPIAGMLHAVFLLLFMLLLSKLIGYVPLASLAAVLFMVAWNMSEQERFRHLLRAPLGDRIVLLLTFALTVLVDLTAAIEVGVVLSAVLFMHRMANAVAMQSHQTLIEKDVDDLNQKSRVTTQSTLPKDVQLVTLRGPFFFGVASRLSEVLDRIGKPPRLFILDMNRVPLIDVTASSAIKELLKRCERHNTQVVLCDLQAAVADTLREIGLLTDPRLKVTANLQEALQIGHSAP
jgi:sulfate permease, SulP family